MCINKGSDSVRSSRSIALVAFALALGGCSGAPPVETTKVQNRNMNQDIGGVPQAKEFKEAEVVLPAYPAESDLIEFLPRRNSTNRYYVDPKSISIGPDKVVRYSAVIKSQSGALNTSYEGLRCKTSEFKVYAYGIKSGDWTRARDPQWLKIPRASHDFRFALYKDYFCDIEAIAGHNEKDLVANLKGNPLNSAADKGRGTCRVGDPAC